MASMLTPSNAVMLPVLRASMSRVTSVTAKVGLVGEHRIVGVAQGSRHGRSDHQDRMLGGHLLLAEAATESQKHGQPRPQTVDGDEVKVIILQLVHDI
ncbi:hypothetical protein JVU11DRAFT_9092 [Chiua virens]|nr:hypothetical protein JVU11DRAFT_9092 [Chiua virens]